MDLRNCVPYFVNTPPPNISKDLGDGGKVEGSKSNSSRNVTKLDTNASQKNINSYIFQNNPRQKVADIGVDKHVIETGGLTARSRYSTENNSVTGLRDSSKVLLQNKTNRYRLKNDLNTVSASTEKPRSSSSITVNSCYEQQNYVPYRHNIDAGKSYEITRVSSTNSTIDLSRPPPVSQIPSQQYHSKLSQGIEISPNRYQSSTDSWRSPEVTKRPSIDSVLQQSRNLRSPQSVQRQQSSRLQSSGTNLGPPQGSQRSSLNSNMTRTPEVLQKNCMASPPPPRPTPPTAHLVGSTGTTEERFIKTEPALTEVRPPPRQPPMPAGPPPSSTPPPPPPGPPPEIKRQMQTPPFDVKRQLQTPPHETNKQLLPPLSQEMQRQLMVPPGPPPDLMQQMQTPPPPFTTPPEQHVLYAQTMPFYLATGSYTNGMLFSVPPPPISIPRAVPGTILQGSPTIPCYNQGNPYVSHQNSGYNYYKRNRVTDNLDPELRRGSKKKKKSLAQILPQRKGWSVEDARKAMEIEKECSRNMRKYSLFIKFPDPELNREIVSTFHSAIESVHFQQPSTPRFCFVNISSSADPEAVRQELNKVQFGGGYLTAEFKKDREDDFNINLEDIDPTTLYVGNLAQEVTKDDMLRTYPKTKRIDIGYAKKMKFTRYAFVAFKTAADAMEAYKKTHDTQMYNKSLIVRFRRLNGTIGMLGEPKVQSKTETDQSPIKNSETNDQVPSEENRSEDHSPWDIDVSTWDSSYNGVSCVDDDDEDDDMMDVKPYLEDLENDVKVPRQYITPFMSGPIDLGDLPRPIILDEIKKEKGTEESAEEHPLSDSQDESVSIEALPVRPPVDLDDSANTSSNGEVAISDLNNTVTLKTQLEAKIKSEIDEKKPDDRTLRSTYRQLMLARRQKKTNLKVKEDPSTTIEYDEHGMDESLNDSQPENAKIGQVHSQNVSTEDSIRASAIKSPDRNMSQTSLEKSSSATNAGKQLSESGNNEICGEMIKKTKEETPPLPTKISSYADLRQVGKKMELAATVEVKKENEKDDICEQTSTTEQEEETVQPAGLSQNEDNLTDVLNSPPPSNTKCSNNELEFDFVMEICAREDEMSKEKNNEFNFDLDFDKLNDIKTEPRMEDDSENDADLDEDDDDDDFSNFLKRRKVQT